MHNCICPKQRYMNHVHTSEQNVTNCCGVPCKTFNLYLRVPLKKSGHRYSKYQQMVMFKQRVTLLTCTILSLALGQTFTKLPKTTTLPYNTPFCQKTSDSDRCLYLETVGCRISALPYLTFRGSQIRWWDRCGVHRVTDTTALACSRSCASDCNVTSNQSATWNYWEKYQLSQMHPRDMLTRASCCTQRWIQE